jgi:hypothetical protein
MTTPCEKDQTKDELVKLGCRQACTVYMREYVQQMEAH